MSTQIAVRLNDVELGILDAEVADGRAHSRSDALRKAVADLNRRRAWRQDAKIMEGVLAAGNQIYPDLPLLPSAWPKDAIASAFDLATSRQ